MTPAQQAEELAMNAANALHGFNVRYNDHRAAGIIQRQCKLEQFLTEQRQHGTCSVCGFIAWKPNPSDESEEHCVVCTARLQIQTIQDAFVRRISEDDMTFKSVVEAKDAIIERLRRDLADPPLDVQKLVIRKLNLVAAESLDELRAELAESQSEIVQMGYKLAAMKEEIAEVNERLGRTKQVNAVLRSKDDKWRESSSQLTAELAEAKAGKAEWLVWSNEHRAYWRPNRAGYTHYVESAGRYSKTEAIEICRDARSREGRIPPETMIHESCVDARKDQQ